MADPFSVLLARLAEQHERDVSEAAIHGSLAAVRNLVEENCKMRKELEELRLRSELEESRAEATSAVRNLVEENCKIRKELEELRLRSELEQCCAEASRDTSIQTSLPHRAADRARTLPGVPTETDTNDGAPRGPLLSFRHNSLRLVADPEMVSTRTSCTSTSRRATIGALERPVTARKDAYPSGSMSGQRSPSVVDSLRSTMVTPWRSDGSRPGIERTLTCAKINKAVSALDKTHRIKQGRRFQHILKLHPRQGKNLSVTVDDVYAALQKRRAGRFSVADVATIFDQLRVVAASVLPAGAFEEPERSHGLPFKMFVELVLMADLPGHVDREMADDIADFQNVFLSDDVNDVIWRVSHRQAVSDFDHNQYEEEASTTIKWLSMLNTLAGGTVVVSLVFLSLSLDFSPNWLGWVVFEAIFLCVFLLEILAKLWLLKWRRFCCGPEYHVNWLDTFIMMTATFDVLISIATFNATQSVTRVTMVLRVLRLSRVARLLKLLQTPLLKSLANLLAGFIIGVPWLLWVLVLLISVLFIMGIIFRYMLGPSDGEDLLSTCGSGDDADITDPECKVHYLYGEEFFGSVHKSMFTVFRCMIGDCTTRGGQALTVHFSQGFGLRFDMTYFVGMVIVIFGLFNIITSIFVEATLSGLKHNDVQRKYHKLYEARYVEGKLKALVRRINDILRFEEKNINNHGRMSSFSSTSWDSDRQQPLGSVGNFSLSESQFVTLMQDPVVNSLFDDLDVVQFNRTGLFEMFDTNGSGYISLVELVETLVKLRGDPQKSDMVAAWVGLRALHEKFECFQMLLLENQKMMLANQDRFRDAFESQNQSSEDQ